MFLRKLGKRGVAMTEYAVLLAFVAAIGGSFASDNGLGQSIMNAITGAKNAITDAGSDIHKSDRISACPHISSDHQNILASVVDGLYDYFQKDNMQLAKIKIGNDGKIEEVKYYDGNNIKTLSKSDYTLTDVSGFIDNANFTISNNSCLSFNKEGKVISQSDNNWSKLFINDKSLNTTTEIGFNIKSGVFQPTSHEGQSQHDACPDLK